MICFLIVVYLFISEDYADVISVLRCPLLSKTKTNSNQCFIEMIINYKYLQVSPLGPYG